MNLKRTFLLPNPDTANPQFEVVVVRHWKNNTGGAGITESHLMVLMDKVLHCQSTPNCRYQKLEYLNPQ